jgi:hypothetical protein
MLATDGASARTTAELGTLFHRLDTCPGRNEWLPWSSIEVCTAPGIDGYLILYKQSDARMRPRRGATGSMLTVPTHLPAASSNSPYSLPLVHLPGALRSSRRVRHRISAASFGRSRLRCAVRLIWESMFGSPPKLPRHSLPNGAPKVLEPYSARSPSKLSRRFAT